MHRRFTFAAIACLWLAAYGVAFADQTPKQRAEATVRRRVHHPVATKGKTAPKPGKGSAEPAAGSGSEPGGELFIKRQ